MIFLHLEDTYIVTKKREIVRERFGKCNSISIRVQGMPTSFKHSVQKWPHKTNKRHPLPTCDGEEGCSLEAVNRFSAINPIFFPQLLICAVPRSCILISKQKKITKWPWRIKELFPRYPSLTNPIHQNYTRDNSRQAEVFCLWNIWKLAPGLWVISLAQTLSILVFSSAHNTWK